MKCSVWGGNILPLMWREDMRGEYAGLPFADRYGVWSAPVGMYHKLSKSYRRWSVPPPSNLALLFLLLAPMVSTDKESVGSVLSRLKVYETLSISKPGYHETAGNYL
ncbi:hypothetical protein AVEN_127742-1 [Araneus ventricosus]|uniref:Uncharacterized protein n=1 Tax=Araneus ventricosus TaxID=182803 RepID=A0A4Y2ECY7_ARAVE|nr:hypothetical protein AVEN_127742-1 [Araneus ventricosus]